MVIFSGRSGYPKPNANALVCAMKPFVDVPGDHRLVNPQSEEIFVRFLGDFGPSVDSIKATLVGLGFNRTETDPITLTRKAAGQSEFWYESAILPLSSNATGCIRTQLTLLYGGAAAGSTAFHTAGSTCP